MPKGKRKGGNLSINSENDNNDNSQSSNEVEEMAPSTSTGRRRRNSSVKKRNSPRKLGRKINKRKSRQNEDEDVNSEDEGAGMLQGGEAVFEEDGDQVDMATEEMETEFLNEENREDPSHEVFQRENKPVEDRQEENKNDEEEEEGQLSANEDETTRPRLSPQPIRRRKNKTTRKRSVQDIEKEIQEVNRAVAKMQRMMEEGLTGDRPTEIMVCLLIIMLQLYRLSQPFIKTQLNTLMTRGTLYVIAHQLKT